MTPREYKEKYGISYLKMAEILGLSSAAIYAINYRNTYLKRTQITLLDNYFKDKFSINSWK